MKRDCPCGTPTRDRFLSVRRGILDLESKTAPAGNRGLTTNFDSAKKGLLMNARACKIADCAKPARTNGMCRMHDSRMRRTGTTDKRPSPTPADDAVRFMSKVAKTESCWLFTGTVLSTGYGQFTAQGRRHSSHRYAYELWVGPLSEGLTIDHVRDRGCAFLHCVNPDHLEPVTIEENLRRRWQWEKSHQGAA